MISLPSSSLMDAVLGLAGERDAKRQVVRTVEDCGATTVEREDGRLIVVRNVSRASDGFSRWLSQVERVLSDRIWTLGSPQVFVQVRSALSGRAGAGHFDQIRAVHESFDLAVALEASADLLRMQAGAASDLMMQLRGGSGLLVSEPIVSRARHERVLLERIDLAVASAGRPVMVSAEHARLLECLGYSSELDRWLLMAAVKELDSRTQTRIACPISAATLSSHMWWIELFSILRAMPTVAQRLTVSLRSQDAPIPSRFALELLRGLRSLGCGIAVEGFGDSALRMDFCRVVEPSLIVLSPAVLRHAASSSSGLDQYQHLAALARSLAPVVVAAGVGASEDVGLLARSGVSWRLSLSTETVSSHYVKALVPPEPGHLPIEG